MAKVVRQLSENAWKCLRIVSFIHRRRLTSWNRLRRVMLRRRWLHLALEIASIGPNWNTWPAHPKARTSFGLKTLAAWIMWKDNLYPPPALVSEQQWFLNTNNSVDFCSTRSKKLICCSHCAIKIILLSCLLLLFLKCSCVYRPVMRDQVSQIVKIWIWNFLVTRFNWYFNNNNNNNISTEGQKNK